jgi:Cu(I)/Ag(I) efflux system membrane fusion protein
MSARVTLALTAARDTLVIPTEALIRTGTQTRVMVAEGDGRFRTQAVRIGNEIADQTQILAGLQEGDQVVVSGQFLLDSEARLQGVPVVGVDATGMAADSSADAEVIEMILHEADGRIVALGDGEVRLAHGAFPTLPMPGMTMTFPLANDSVTQGLAVGDNVRIGLSQTDAGVLIERLQKLDDAGVTEVQP